MIRLLAVASAVLLTGAPTARAQHGTPPLAPHMSAVKRCDRAGAFTNMDILMCLATHAERQDARLNRAYKAAMSRLRTPREKIALRDVQRAWIEDRDADCQPYLDDTQYGRQAGIEFQGCLYDWSSDRADELERDARRSR